MRRHGQEHDPHLGGPAAKERGLFCRPLRPCVQPGFLREWVPHGFCRCGWCQAVGFAKAQGHQVSKGGMVCCEICFHKVCVLLHGVRAFTRCACFHKVCVFSQGVLNFTRCACLSHSDSVWNRFCALICFCMISVCRTLNRILKTMQPASISCNSSRHYLAVFVCVCVPAIHLFVPCMQDAHAL